MLTQKEQELFGVNASISKKSHDTTTYQIECDTSNGTMHCYHLFPGIDLVHTAFQASYCFMREKPLPHILEIAYCKSGRFECEYTNGYFTYLGEGDFAVSTMHIQQELPTFPMGNYDGIAIIIDLNVTGPVFSNIVEGVSIDLIGLVRKFCTDRYCSVIKANSGVLHVFNEIFQAHSSENLGYLRLKVLEIFLLLADLLPQNNIETSSYFSRSQTKKIKELKTELMETLDSKESLKNIAKRYGLSLTTMKDCFKAVYGKPIRGFQREYKMQLATQLLVTSNLSVSEISGRLGYENPNKFSDAFKSIIGLSPREYRINNK